MLKRARWVHGLLVAASGFLLPCLALAAPTASFIAHRGTAGGSNPAPLYVHFDATATTSSVAGDNAFFDLHYTWDFGDPTSGNWGTNATPKNRAFGGVSGHLFEKPGVYTVKLTVSDRAGATSTATRTITVTDPAVAWPAAVTACVSATGDFTGCPVSGAGQLVSSSWSQAIDNRLRAGFRRILFHRGENFTAAGDYASLSGTPGVMIAAYGTATLPKPRINMTSGASPGAALGLRSNDWRLMDLDFQEAGSDLIAVSNAAVVSDIVLLRLRIQTRRAFNVQFESNGPPIHQYIALIDNDLVGNSVGLVGELGSCFYGGAARYFMSGNRCGRANAWQMRVIHSDRSAFSNNIISENAGAFESLKMHCTGGTASTCRFNVVSDNVLAKQRLRVTEGAAEEGAIFKDSIIERNFINGEIGTEHPGNLYRYNVAHTFHVRVRVFNAQLTRGNMVVNNTFFNNGSIPAAVSTDPGTDVDGMILRNNLFYAKSIPSPVILAEGGVGNVLQENNRVVVGTTSPFVSTNPLAPRDYALVAGSTLIDAGKVGPGPSLDLLFNPAPRGVPDVGAVESGSTVVVDAPPAAPVLLSVEVVP